MTEIEVNQLIGSIEQLVDKRIEAKIGKCLLVQAATIKSISPNKLNANIQILGDNSIISDVPIYNVRSLSVGDSCFVGYWGNGGKRMNNIVVLFGGSDFA